MKLGITKQLISLMVIMAMFTLALTIDAQTRRRPRLRRHTRRAVVVVPAGVPVGTNLKVRLEDTLSSKDSSVGDRFTATVLDPVRFNEATVTGHVASIQKSGKIKGRTSMNLDFDSIRYSDGRSVPLHGYVTRVYGSDAGRADNEGGVESGSRTNQTLKRGAIGAGAAIGLILGGAGGAGSLAVQGSKELKLESGTELLVRVTR